MKMSDVSDIAEEIIRISGVPTKETRPIVGAWANLNEETELAASIMGAKGSVLLESIKKEPIRKKKLLKENVRLRYGWLDEYMGDQTTEEEASSFGEYLSSLGYEIPSYLPSNGTEDIRKDGESISDSDWQKLLKRWYEKSESVTLESCMHRVLAVTESLVDFSTQLVEDKSPHRQIVSRWVLNRVCPILEGVMDSYIEDEEDDEEGEGEDQGDEDESDIPEYDEAEEIEIINKATMDLEKLIGRLEGSMTDVKEKDIEKALEDLKSIHADFKSLQLMHGEGEDKGGEDEGDEDEVLPPVEEAKSNQDIYIGWVDSSSGKDYAYVALYKANSHEGDLGKAKEFASKEYDKFIVKTVDSKSKPAMVKKEMKAELVSKFDAKLNEDNQESKKNIDSMMARARDYANTKAPYASLRDLRDWLTHEEPNATWAEVKDFLDGSNDEEQKDSDLDVSPEEKRFAESEEDASSLPFYIPDESGKLRFYHGKTGEEIKDYEGPFFDFSTGKRMKMHTRKEGGERAISGKPFDESVGKISKEEIKSKNMMELAQLAHANKISYADLESAFGEGSAKIDRIFDMVSRMELKKDPDTGDVDEIEEAKSKSVKITYEDGSEVTTSVNPDMSDDSIKKHYQVGSSMNVGDGPNDKMLKIKNVEILGVKDWSQTESKDLSEAGIKGKGEFYLIQSQAGINILPWADKAGVEEVMSKQPPEAKVEVQIVNNTHGTSTVIFDGKAQDWQKAKDSGFKDDEEPSGPRPVETEEACGSKKK